MPKAKTVKKKIDTVEKMLSPEEKTLLANIKSLVEQIEMIEGGGEEEGNEDELILAEGDKPGEEEDNNLKPIGKIFAKVMADEPLDDEEKKSLKSYIEKDETASDDAEARAQGEQEETTEDAINIVKALLKTGLLQEKVVKKQEVNPVLTVLEKLTKVMKDRMDDQDNAISGILEGLGVSKEILTEADKVEKDKVKRVKGDSDAEAVLSMLKKALKGEETEPVAKESNKQLVRKDLKGVMSSIFTQ